MRAAVRLAPLAFVAATLGACAAGPAPDIATPVPDLPADFHYAPDLPTGTALAGLLPLEDPAFVELAQAALAQSPSLAEALARIDAARSRAARAGAERLPAIGADAGISGERLNPGQFGSGLPDGVTFDTERINYAANLTATWDPDIFGRLRALERAGIARAEAAEAQARGVRLALLGEIAASVIDWRTLDAREIALRQDLAAAQDLGRLAGDRERAGLAPGFDRVRAEAEADRSRSNIAALGEERVRLVGRLVTLTATGAGGVRAALASEPPSEAEPTAPASLPSALLVNRPDILAASATLRATDAELAATARRRFPTFDLSATIGLLAFGLGDVLEEDSLVGTLAASVAAPLIDFGRIEAEIDEAAAEKRAAYQAYRGAVFTALGDAEAAYGLIAAVDRQAGAAAREAASLERAADLARFRHRAGLADFLTVLEARRAADASGARAALARGQARRARAVLWQELGGSELPIEPETR